VLIEERNFTEFAALEGPSAVSKADTGAEDEGLAAVYAMVGLM
jgi:hypothetical protein